MLWGITNVQRNHSGDLFLSLFLLWMSGIELNVSFDCSFSNPMK